MKKLLIILNILWFRPASDAQVPENIFNLENYHSVASIDGSVDLGSLSVSNLFMNTFLFGDHIDNTIKHRMFNSLRNNEVLGFDMEENVNYLVLPDSFAGTDNLGIFAGFSNFYHIDANVTEDILRLLFDGNTAYKGKTAILGPSSLDLFSYQQLRFGIISKFGQGKIKHTFGIGIGINKGIDNISVHIDEGSLYTDINAEYLDMNAAYEINRSDTSGKSGFKGIGSSINLFYSFSTANKDHFDFSVSNLGFIKWDKNSQHFNKDTSIHFEGVDISDPLNIEGNIFGNSDPDSLSNIFTKSDTSMRYFMLTPACFRIAYTHHFDGGFSVEGAIIKKLYVHFDPFFLLRVSYHLGQKNILALRLNYGGYTVSDPLKSHNVNTGFEFAHCFGKGFVFKIGTNYLNGFINPKTQTAEGAYFSINKFFF